MKSQIRKIFISLLFISAINCPVEAQSVEISERFRAVIKKLVKKEFKDVVFNELKNNDPILAASTYDLIDQIILGDSIQEIKKQIILSTFDYIEFLSLRSYLINQFPDTIVKRFDGSEITPNDYIKLMSLSSLLTYQFLAEEDLLVVSKGMSKIIFEYSKFYAEFKPVPGFPTAITFAGSISEFMDQNKNDILKTIHYVATLKNIVVSISTGDSVPANLIDKYNLLVAKNIFSSADFIISIQDTVRSMLLNLREEVGNYEGKEYADIYSTVAPYVNSIIFQKINQDKADYGKQMLGVFVEKLESVYSENNLGIKYKLGLWSGLFITGATWDPPTATYPILSFRLNDRVQYTFSDSICGNMFVYIGGFSDILIKELSNKTSNQFGYFGLGLEMNSISIALSATLPINKNANDIGFVISVMYDLPIEELLE